ncbi:hypothetical protein J6590_087937 [Homalodisca vitripennis]|nr:hypothetical protein J6590_087937 [Homalodisca vitripennis]
MVVLTTLAALVGHSDASADVTAPAAYVNSASYNIRLTQPVSVNAYSRSLVSPYVAAPYVAAYTNPASPYVASPYVAAPYAAAPVVAAPYAAAAPVVAAPVKYADAVPAVVPAAVRGK